MNLRGEEHDKSCESKRAGEGGFRSQNSSGCREEGRTGVQKDEESEGANGNKEVEHVVWGKLEHEM